MDFCLGGGSTDRIAVGRLYATFFLFFFFLARFFFLLFVYFYTVFSVFLITVRSSQLNSKVLVINSLEFRSHPLYRSTVFRIHFTINKGILNRHCILKGTIVLLRMKNFLDQRKLSMAQRDTSKGREREGRKRLFSPL